MTFNCKYDLFSVTYPPDVILSYIWLILILPTDFNGFVFLFSGTFSYLSMLTRTLQYWHNIFRFTSKPKMDSHINNFRTFRSELTLEHYIVLSFQMMDLLLRMSSPMNWIWPIIFILGIHYEMVHDIISYAGNFVFSVLVVFIVFNSYRYSRYHDSEFVTIGFHLNMLTRYHEPVLVFIQGDHVSFQYILVL